MGHPAVQEPLSRLGPNSRSFAPLSPPTICIVRGAPGVRVLRMTRRWEESALPGVVDGVGEGGFSFGRDLDGELDGVAVCFGEGGGFFGDLPVVAAVEVLDDRDVDGLRFLV